MRVVEIPTHLNSLLEMLVEFAQLMLSEEGEFYPFAATMALDGELISVGADTGSRNPPSREVINVLFSALASEAAAGKIKAAGICMDVRISPPGAKSETDAICVELEHEDGHAIEVFVPYAVKAASISYAERIVTAGEPRLFLPTAG